MREPLVRCIGLFGFRALTQCGTTSGSRPEGDALPRCAGTASRRGTLGLRAPSTGGPGRCRKTCSRWAGRKPAVGTLGGLPAVGDHLAGRGVRGREQGRGSIRLPLPHCRQTPPDRVAVGAQTKPLVKVSDAFAAYVLPEVDVLYRVALSLTRNHAGAQDLVLDTLLRAHCSIDRFDGRHPRAWLLTIMRNTNIDQNRRRRPGLLSDSEVVFARLEATEPGGAGAEEQSGACSTTRSKRRLVRFRRGSDRWSNWSTSTGGPARSGHQPRDPRSGRS